MNGRITAGLGVALALLLPVPVAFAQGCAMCKTLAEAQGPEGQRAMNLAILVLLIPTVLIFVGILFWAFRFRDRNQTEEFPSAALFRLSVGSSQQKSSPFQKTASLAWPQQGR